MSNIWAPAGCICLTRGHHVCQMEKKKEAEPEKNSQDISGKWFSEAPKEKYLLVKPIYFPWHLEIFQLCKHWLNMANLLAGNSNVKFSCLVASQLWYFYIFTLKQNASGLTEKKAPIVNLWDASQCQKDSLGRKLKKRQPKTIQQSHLWYHGDISHLWRHGLLGQEETGYTGQESQRCTGMSTWHPVTQDRPLR